MNSGELARALIASAANLRPETAPPTRKAEAEGGCGVIGLAASVRVPARVLLQPLEQMRNRGNGKGGGIAAAGLDPEFFGAPPRLLRDDYLLTIAYLDDDARREVEARFVETTFAIDHVAELPACGDLVGLAVRPPDVCCYFVRVRTDVLAGFRHLHGIPEEHRQAAEDEIVFQTSYRLHRDLYSSAGEKRALVLSHGKDLLVLKLVGYGDDVLRAYGIGGLRAHVWIGHHRYPTKGRVWHPGGAHPFVGLHEALVHNGDFANYTSMCAYLAQRNRFPLFLTDTEVAALAFDLLHRVYGYPLEYVLEAIAPTTERDLALLPPDKQRVYRTLQSVHLHSSPDGPWFFLLAQTLRDGACRLVGITDTSMLRPQVFALQQGSEAIGLAASEKQAIDATLECLAHEDGRFWPHADLYWNARGGSHTDGGAFAFTVRDGRLDCTDKFGRRIETEGNKLPPGGGGPPRRGAGVLARLDVGTQELTAASLRELPTWEYGDVRGFLEELVASSDGDEARDRTLATLTALIDRRAATGAMKRSYILTLLDAALSELAERIRRRPSRRYAWAGRDALLPEADCEGATVVTDARGFPSEGSDSLAGALKQLVGRGFRRLLVVNARGQRFLGCGLGPSSQGVRIDIYGPSGDYLASGIDGAEVIMHGSAQDQVAQIMKDGTLIVHGDVGQTFMYAAKGGRAFVLGSAAGRPLINAAGHPRVVINGTCLDYLAESCMAGDPLHEGGFVVVNGLAFDADGSLHPLDTPYPGGNLFSLASGGAVYVRDPDGKLTDDQLNGGEFTPFTLEDWQLLLPYLEENQRLFGIPLELLLTFGGASQPPDRVYRKIRPARLEALSPEEAWVRQHA